MVIPPSAPPETAARSRFPRRVSSLQNLPPAPLPPEPRADRLGARRGREMPAIPPRPTIYNSCSVLAHNSATTANIDALMPAGFIESLSFNDLTSAHSSSISLMTMRKASPLPLPAYPTPTTPWQHATNSLTSPSSDSTPSAGKTTQVLAKLTGDNDRLRREIRAITASRDESQQQFAALKGRVEWLEEKNATLTMQFDANEASLVRKERRIDDLKATLDEEVRRRKRAEDREAEMGRKLGETVSQAAREVSEAHMGRKHAENQYETLRNEYAVLDRRMRFLKQEVDGYQTKLNVQREEQRRQFTELEVLLDHERHVNEICRKQVLEMSELLQSYKGTEENVLRLEKALQDTVHEMRWVMRLQESRGGGENEAPQLPPPPIVKSLPSKKNGKR